MFMELSHVEGLEVSINRSSANLCKSGAAPNLMLIPTLYLSAGWYCPSRCHVIDEIRAPIMSQAVFVNFINRWSL